MSYSSCRATTRRWLDALPDSLADGAMAEALQAICELDLFPSAGLIILCCCVTGLLINTLALDYIQ